MIQLYKKIYSLLKAKNKILFINLIEIVINYIFFYSLNFNIYINKLILKLRYLFVFIYLIPI